MNRQAITFLTLFSLILVLSIYYILLPPENTANEVAVNNQEVSQIEALQKNLDKEREDLISENNAIIASSESDSDKIASALATISEAKETAALEAKITKTVNEAGFKNVFVEVENKTVKVVVDKKDGSGNDANSIINAIMEETKNEYQVEVKLDFEGNMIPMPGSGPVTVRLNKNNQVIVDVAILIDYGLNVTSTTNALQNKIAQSCFEMTGIKNIKVNIEVKGINF